MMEGLISDIQRFAIHDGPGIRTTVFLKGCPLSCRWCANPETISPNPEIMFFSDRCIRCGLCVEACPNKAIKIGPESLPLLDRTLCNGCGQCVEACPRNARILRGKRISSAEVVWEVLKDLPYYRRSGGGVTLSGGEPFRQPAFIREILVECKKNDIHTAVDTSGYVEWSSIEPSINFIDLFLYDVKHVDAAAHKKGTGVSNELIKLNLIKLLDQGKDVLLRLPLIPEFNTSKEDIEAIGEFVRQIGGKEIRLLPYHNYGKGKYERINRVYHLDHLPLMAEEDVETIRSTLERYIPAVVVGG